MTPLYRALIVKSFRLHHRFRRGAPIAVVHLVCACDGNGQEQPLPVTDQTETLVDSQAMAE